ncbi:zinc finger, CCHC-type containing protein [Tanacetum coccineum]
MDVDHISKKSAIVDYHDSKVTVDEDNVDSDNFLSTKKVRELYKDIFETSSDPACIHVKYQKNTVHFGLSSLVRPGPIPTAYDYLSLNIRGIQEFLQKQKLTGPTSLIVTDNYFCSRAWVKGQKEVVVLMLLTMDLDIQRNLAHLGAYDMLQELKAMFSIHLNRISLAYCERFFTLASRRKEAETRALSPMRRGDGHRAAVEAIETYHLELPSGLVIVLNNCHYAPSITRDSSLLWHCRLGHISKKRIEKLQHDGLLNSIDIESLGKCVSCLSGKMARKPYSHQVERAKDLLGLIQH